MPVTSRWYTVIKASEFTNSLTAPLRALSNEMFFKLPSAKKVMRQMWRELDIWLGSSILRCHVAIMVDIGDVYYTPEMVFSTASPYQCALLPARWAFRIKTLRAALEDPASYFPTVHELLVGASPEDNDRVKLDLHTFLTTFLTHSYDSYARVWLAFPHVACGLGDPSPGVMQCIAKALVAAREGENIDGLGVGVLENLDAEVLFCTIFTTTTRSLHQL